MTSKRKLSLEYGSTGSSVAAGSTDTTPVDSNNTSDASDLVSAAEALTSLQSISSPPATEEKHPLISKVNQLSGHPIVTNAVKYYESTKRNYPQFSYAADIVEKAALPVVNRIEVNLNSRHQQRLADEDLSIKKRKVVEPEKSSCYIAQPTKDIQTETKKRLQFCLHILRLANDNITGQVNSLQQIVEEHQQEQKLKEEKLKEKMEDKSYEKEHTPEQVTETAKTEIAVTVKKIIHLISNFKPSSLSTDSSDLKTSIRDIILNLPSQINGTDKDKVFVFAKESLDMITKLTNVFNDQLTKAESWIGVDNEENDLTAVNSNEKNDSNTNASTETLTTTTNISSDSRSTSNGTAHAQKDNNDRITIEMLTK